MSACATVHFPPNAGSEPSGEPEEVDQRDERPALAESTQASPRLELPDPDGLRVAAVPEKVERRLPGAVA